MCGGAEIVFTRDFDALKVQIYLGYYGCYIKINNKVFAPQGINNREGWQIITKEEFIDLLLSSFSHKELAELIAQLVEEGEEY